MPEGWKVRSQVHIEHPDGSRTIKPFDRLTAAERQQMLRIWKRNAEQEGYEVEISAAS